MCAYKVKWHLIYFQPLLNSNKHIDKSVDYEFLLPWLNTGLLLR